MQNKLTKKIAICLLSLCCLFSFVCGAIYAVKVDASNGSIILSPDYVDENFTIIDRDLDTTDDTTLAKVQLSFVNITSSREVMLISKTKLTAPYTIELSMYSNTDGYPDGAFVIGHDDYTVGGNSIETGGGLYIDRSAGSLVPWQGTKLYSADGTTEVTGNFIPGVVGDWAINKEFLYKFEVLENGHVNVYFDFADTPDALTTLRNVIKPEDGGDLEITKSGYFVFAPRVESIDNGKVRTLQYVSENGNKTVFTEIDADKWNIVGNAEKAVIAADFAFIDKNESTVASKFAFTDTGLNDGDTVFDITFRSSRLHGATSPTWGLAFGMESANMSIDSTDRYELSVLSGQVYKGAEAQTNGNGASYATGIYNTGGDVTIRLVGKKGGILEEYRGIGAAGNVITDLYTTYSGLDFNGYIAFYSLAGADSAATDTVKFNDISIQGNVEFVVESVSLNKGVFDAAVIGNDITLMSTVIAYPDIDSGVVYSVIEGYDLCTLKDNILSIKGSGSITVRATSKDDSSVYDEYTFIARSLEFERYYLQEEFSELNSADWNVIDEDGNITVDEGAYIKGDNVNEAGGSAKVVSNVYFMADPENDTVFDITFTSGLLSSGTFRDPSYSWGLIFGMKSQSAKAGDDGVGYVKVDYNHTFIFLGGNEVTPTYMSERKSNAGDVFFESPYDITLRVVGRKDGVLELYRGYSVYEDINTLFATYSGFDFNGYVALTTQSTSSGNDNEDYQIRFMDVTLEGNVSIDNYYEVKNVVIDSSVFKDAIVSEIPIEVSVKVNCIPNLNAYGGYTLEVVSGPATLDGNKLTITGEGEIKIKATSVLDNTVFTEYSFEATNLVITDIIWAEDLFSGLNSDSQPVQLSARVESNMLANKYQELVWEVESGNAVVVADQLRITGAGHVVLKVSTVYGDFSKTIEFDVAQVNDGEHNPVINDEGVADKKGCSGALNASSFVIPLLLCGVLVLLKKKRAH